MPATPDQPLRHLPLIPEPVLRRHRVFEPSDTRFRACARLLQALWREQHQLPIGTHASPDGTRAAATPPPPPPPPPPRRAPAVSSAPASHPLPAGPGPTSSARLWPRSP